MVLGAFTQVTDGKLHTHVCLRSTLERRSTFRDSMVQELLRTGWSFNLYSWCVSGFTSSCRLRAMFYYVVLLAFICM